MTTLKPLLASPANLDLLTYPLYASPKLDGIRALMVGGRLVSRKLLDIPNKHVQALVRDLPNGIDGELIDGDPTAPDVYLRTNSLVMSNDKPIGSSLQLHLFDVWDRPGVSYTERYAELLGRNWGQFACVLTQMIVSNRDELDAYEANAVAKGYEGVMLRSMRAHYKHGRSTAKEGILLKVKRYEDSDAVIIGVEEEMHNGNEAERDNLGRTKRSTAKGGKTGKGTMGALVVRDLKTGVEFNIGTGFTAADRAAEWKLGEIVKYKFFPVGVKDKPRHPVYLGRRSKLDL